MNCVRHSTRGGKCGVSLACAKSVSVTRVRPLRGHLAIAGSSCLNYHRHRRGSYNSTLTVSELTRNWFNFNSFFFFFCCYFFVFCVVTEIFQCCFTSQFLSVRKYRRGFQPPPGRRPWIYARESKSSGAAAQKEVRCASSSWPGALT